MLPVASSFVTNVCRLPAPAYVLSYAPGVTGKSVEFVSPVRYAAPAESIATSWAMSVFEPPRNVE